MVNKQAFAGICKKNSAFVHELVHVMIIWCQPGLRGTTAENMKWSRGTMLLMSPLAMGAPDEKLAQLFLRWRVQHNMSEHAAVE